VALLGRWRDAALALEREVLALWYAGRDPRVSWYAKLLAVAVVAYAFSPIDLIPDFIPVLGLLDELLIVPLGVLAVRALIAPEVMADCRERAARLQDRPGRNWIAAGVLVALWLAAAAGLAYWLLG
jgi:uncharacterized membrane protein YkvA (DUF1232 family)